MTLTLDKTLLGKPKEKYWISYIKSRIRKNKNFLGFVSGQTGSGKSWASISLGEQLDKNFTIDNVVFSAVDLMNLINGGTLKRGSVIVFEESGVEFNNKSWASKTNKAINYLLQTFRHKGFILIMNSPYMDFLDSGMRKLFHAELQTVGINRTKQTCKIKPQLIQYNGRNQKYYYKRLKVITDRGAVPIDRWCIDKPSDSLIKDYEFKKVKFTFKLNRDILAELLADKNKNKPKQKKPKELTQIQEETLGMLKNGFTTKDMAKARNRDETVIRRAMQSLKAVGYEFKANYTGKTISSYDVRGPVSLRKNG